jgi:hypothetical protein
MKTSHRRTRCVGETRRRPKNGDIELISLRTSSAAATIPAGMPNERERVMLTIPPTDFAMPNIDFEGVMRQLIETGKLPILLALRRTPFNSLLSALGHLVKLIGSTGIVQAVITSCMKKHMS